MRDDELTRKLSGACSIEFERSCALEGDRKTYPDGRSNKSRLMERLMVVAKLEEFGLLVVSVSCVMELVADPLF